MATVTDRVIEHLRAGKAAEMRALAMLGAGGGGAAAMGEVRELWTQMLAAVESALTHAIDDKPRQAHEREAGTKLKEP